MDTERERKIHSEKRIRTRQINLRLSEEEYAHVKNQAGMASLGLQDYFRRLSLGSCMKPIAKYPDDVYAAIRSVGNNLNQLTRKANNQERLAREEIQQLESLIGSLIGRLGGG